MIKFIFRVFIALFAMTTICGHTSATTKADLEKIIQETKTKLPINILEGIMWTDLDIVDGYFRYTYVYPSIIVDYFKTTIADKEASTLKLIERNKTIATAVQDAGLGIQYVYLEEGTQKEIDRLGADNKQLKKILKQIEKDATKKQSFLESLQTEIASMTFPQDMGDGIILKTAYLQGTKVCYEVEINTIATPEEIGLTAKDIEDTKKDLASGLKKELAPAYKGMMEAENVSYVYIYKNSNNQELYRIEITAKDIWK